MSSLDWSRNISNCSPSDCSVVLVALFARAWGVTDFTIILFGRLPNQRCVTLQLGQNQKSKLRYRILKISDRLSSSVNVGSRDNLTIKLCEILTTRRHCSGRQQRQSSNHGVSHLALYHWLCTREVHRLTSGLGGHLGSEALIHTSLLTSNVTNAKRTYSICLTPGHLPAITVGFFYPSLSFTHCVLLRPLISIPPTCSSLHLSFARPSSTSLFALSTPVHLIFLLIFSLIAVNNISALLTSHL